MEIENIVANTVFVKARAIGQLKGRSRKWRQMLQFPHYTMCLPLKEQIDVRYKYVIEKQPIGKMLFKQFCEETSPELCRCWQFLELVEEFEMNDDDEDRRRDCAKEIFRRLEGHALQLKKSEELGGAENGEPLTNGELPTLASGSEEVPSKNGEASAAGEDSHLSESENSTNNAKLAHQFMTHEFIQKCIELAREASKADHPALGTFSSVYKEVRNFLSVDPFKQFVDSMYFHRYLQWKYIESRPIDKHTFRIYRTLGKGGFGEVCACQSRVSGKMYALKKLEKKRVKKRHAESLTLNEKQILERINSPFIVSLAYAFETKDALCLVLTLLNGGDLKFHLYTLCPGGFEEKRVQFYAAEILLGLQHLHKEKIIYRDLKPENILLDDDGHCRISDLGLAVEVKDNKPISGRVGTVGYMAPEVVKNESYSYGVDWWALGCLIYEMIDGRAPFRQRKEKVKREEVERRVVMDHEKYNDKFSEAARNLCRGLLQKDQKLRIGSRMFTAPHEEALEIKLHPFFAQSDTKTGREQVPWRKMESGNKIKPPFIPDPNSVYAKDVLDIEQFSTVKGIKLEPKDNNFYRKFNTGSVSIPFQNEMLETKIFYDMNIFFEGGGLAADLTQPDCWSQRRGSKLDFIINIFRKKDRSNSEFNPVLPPPSTISSNCLPGCRTPLGSTKCPRCRLNNTKCRCPSFKSAHDLRSQSIVEQHSTALSHPSTSRGKAKSEEATSSDEDPTLPIKAKPNNGGKTVKLANANANNSTLKLSPFKQHDTAVTGNETTKENNGHLPNNHISSNNKA